MLQHSVIRDDNILNNFIKNKRILTKWSLNKNKQNKYLKYSRHILIDKEIRINNKSLERQYNQIN